jgi:hypothetical protein
MKTADLSHMTDKRPATATASFIPPEFRREVTTPTPLNYSSELNPVANTWHTQIFPTDTADSRSEVLLLSDWLNQVLQKNMDDFKDDHMELAKNARNWYSIAFNELCRQVGCECLARAQLLLSIWKRYQSLFDRVGQLHEEERTYLVQNHKERLTKLKSDLEDAEKKLKSVAQNYKNDQERWTNEREREEARFSNLRKKLDLQVKNKRNLQLRLKALKEKCLSREQKGVPVESQEDPTVKPQLRREINRDELSDRLHAVRQIVRNDFPEMPEIASMMDDVVHYLDEEPLGKNVRDLAPHIFQVIPLGVSARIRSKEWLWAMLEYIYANKLSDRCKGKESGAERLHFVDYIMQLFLRIYGQWRRAAETFFDLVSTARNIESPKCSLFLKFIDCSTEYFDNVQLDFFVFCLGMAYNATSGAVSLLEGFDPVQVAKKVLSVICEAEIAERYMKRLPEDPDLVFEFLLGVYKMEEERVANYLKEHFEMDAAEYNGIVTLGQFQTLVMFSPKRLEIHAYTEMMAEAFMESKTQTISFGELIQIMHRWGMILPFMFSRVAFDVTATNFQIEFMNKELDFYRPEVDALMSKLRKADEALHGQLMAVKNKLEQSLAGKRSGPLLDLAHREFYGLLAVIVVE